MNTAITNDTPIRRKPAMPGEILHEEFMEPMGIGVAALAQAIVFPVKAFTRYSTGREQ